MNAQVSKVDPAKVDIDVNSIMTAIKESIRMGNENLNIKINDGQNKPNQKLDVGSVIKQAI
ncbi:MAG: hypothetical protein KJ732_07285 [Candidatus Margulisbacteria bacterium]|nr:hypothetical protein [Candidatus Margulisiibacteriota bacterium]